MSSSGSLFSVSMVPTAHQLPLPHFLQRHKTIRPSGAHIPSRPLSWPETLCTGVVKEMQSNRPGPPFLSWGYGRFRDRTSGSLHAKQQQRILGTSKYIGGLGWVGGEVALGLSGLWNESEAHPCQDATLDFMMPAQRISWLWKQGVRWSSRIHTSCRLTLFALRLLRPTLLNISDVAARMLYLQSLSERLSDRRQRKG